MGKPQGGGNLVMDRERLPWQGGGLEGGEFEHGTRRVAPLLQAEPPFHEAEGEQRKQEKADEGLVRPKRWEGHGSAGGEEARREEARNPAQNEDEQEHRKGEGNEAGGVMPTRVGIVAMEDQLHREEDCPGGVGEQNDEREQEKAEDSPSC